jgi:regulator of protease activity HflC (stomatin/prohibitin superfamily)
MLGEAAVLVVVIVVVSKTMVVVPPGWEYVVARGGRFRRVLKPGVHFGLAPLVDRVVRKLPTEERVLPVPAVTGVNEEMLPLTVESRLSYRVVDSQKVYETLDDAAASLVGVAQAAIAGALKEYTLERALVERRSLEGAVKRRLEGGTRRWGIEVTSFTVDAVTPPEEVVREIERRAAREKAGD